MGNDQSGTGWRSRIVGQDEISPDKLIPNPRNWRRHPSGQSRALGEVLDRVGWVQRVIVNRTTGHLVDGHLRVELALRRKETAVPVEYVELSEEDEALVLATLDPLAAMAETDEEMLAELVASVGDFDFSALDDDHDVTTTEEGTTNNDYKPSYSIMIECADEDEQANIIYKLTQQGITCKALIL